MKKSPTIHWGGGAKYRSGKSVVHMASGWPCCCSGDRAVRIARSGWQRFNESDINEVTCKRCIEILSKRIDKTEGGAS